MGIYDLPGYDRWKLQSPYDDEPEPKEYSDKELEEMGLNLIRGTRYERGWNISDMYEYLYSRNPALADSMPEDVSDADIPKWMPKVMEEIKKQGWYEFCDQFGLLKEEESEPDYDHDEPPDDPRADYLAGTKIKMTKTASGYNTPSLPGRIFKSKQALAAAAKRREFYSCPKCGLKQRLNPMNECVKCKTHLIEGREGN